MGFALNHWVEIRVFCCCCTEGERTMGRGLWEKLSEIEMGFLLREDWGCGIVVREAIDDV